MRSYRSRFAPSFGGGLAIAAIVVAAVLVVMMARYGAAQYHVPANAGADAAASSSSAAASPTSSVPETGAQASGGPVSAPVDFLNAPLTAWWDQRVTLHVRTSPNAACSIDVAYRFGSSGVVGLDPKTSDASGLVSWNWLVAKGTDPGRWPIYVTCGLASGRTYIDVK